MTAQRWWLVGIAAALLNGTGCVSCGYDLCRRAQEVSPSCPTDASQRNRVYVFAVSGLTPHGALALDSLRNQLNENGFSKIGTATCVHTPWVATEMRRIHADDPDAVFVLVGVESGCSWTTRLAEKAAAEGIPVAAVVLIDASGNTPAPTGGMRTLTIGSGYGLAQSTAATSVPLLGVSRFALPTDQRTIAAVVGLLTEVASTVPLVLPEVVAAWDYPHAPPARPVVKPAANPEWSYLFDQPGAGPRPIGETWPTSAARTFTPRADR